MPIVTIQQSPRDIELKRKLAEQITAAFVDCYDLAPEAIQIFFNETSHENWSKAGVLAADKPSVPSNSDPSS